MKPVRDRPDVGPGEGFEGLPARPKVGAHVSNSAARQIQRVESQPGGDPGNAAVAGFRRWVRAVEQNQQGYFLSLSAQLLGHFVSQRGRGRPASQKVGSVRLNASERLHLVGSIVFEPVWTGQSCAIRCKHSQKRLIQTEPLRKAIEHRTATDTVKWRTGPCWLDRNRLSSPVRRVAPDQRGQLIHGRCLKQGSQTQPDAELSLY